MGHVRTRTWAMSSWPLVYGWRHGVLYSLVDWGVRRTGQPQGIDSLKPGNDEGTYHQTTILEAFIYLFDSFDVCLGNYHMGSNIKQQAIDSGTKIASVQQCPLVAKLQGTCFSFRNLILTHLWLVVWNMNFLTSMNIGNVSIPTDEHIFQRGRYATNQIWLRVWKASCFPSKRDDWLRRQAFLGLGMG
jgi:hypothetical protein